MHKSHNAWVCYWCSASVFLSNFFFFPGRGGELHPQVVHEEEDWLDRKEVLFRCGGRGQVSVCDSLQNNDLLTSNPFPTSRFALCLYQYKTFHDHVGMRWFLLGVITVNDHMGVLHSWCELPDGTLWPFVLSDSANFSSLSHQPTMSSSSQPAVPCSPIEPLLYYIIFFSLY